MVDELVTYVCMLIWKSKIVYNVVFLNSFCHKLAFLFPGERTVNEHVKYMNGSCFVVYYALVSWIYEQILFEKVHVKRKTLFGLYIFVSMYSVLVGVLYDFCFSL